MSVSVHLHLSANARKVLERRYLRKDHQGKVCEPPEEMIWRQGAPSILIWGLRRE